MHATPKGLQVDKGSSMHIGLEIEIYSSQIPLAIPITRREGPIGKGNFNKKNSTLRNASNQ